MEQEGGGGGGREDRIGLVKNSKDRYRERVICRVHGGVELIRGKVKAHRTYDKQVYKYDTKENPRRGGGR